MSFLYFSFVAIVILFFVLLRFYFISLFAEKDLVYDPLLFLYFLLFFYLFRVLSWYATPFALKKTQVLTFKLIFVSFILIKLA
jgi:hypothetical protein